MQLRVISSTE